MKAYFNKLYRYNHWANSQIMECLEKYNVRDEEIIKLMSHIATAQHIWLDRIHNRPSERQTWIVYSWELLKNEIINGDADWMKFIEIHSADFSETVSYQNSKGQAFETPLTEIIIHVANHSTYHRAQVARRLRELGLNPPITDYIHYARK